MAEKDMTIEIEDDGEVTVDISDNPDLAVEVEPQPKPVVAAPKPAKTAAVDEALQHSRRQRKRLKTSATHGSLLSKRHKTSAMHVSPPRKPAEPKRRKQKPSVNGPGIANLRL